MVFTRCVFSELQLGALREVLVPVLISIEGSVREEEGTVAESLVGRRSTYRGTLYRVSKHRIRRGRRTARSSMSQESAEPLCARIEGTNREVSEGKVDPRTTISFFPTRTNKERRMRKIP